MTKLDLLNSLWEQGHRPPARWNSDYEEKTRDHLYQLLAIDKQYCSEATTSQINKAAELFQKRVIYYWAKTRKEVPFKNKKYFTEEISVEVTPLSDDIPELAPPSSDHQRPSGSYKSFDDKGKSAQFAEVRSVHQQHHPRAILRAAPKAASELGLPQLATAIRKMEKDPEVLPALAIEGMKNTSMYALY